MTGTNGTGLSGDARNALLARMRQVTRAAEAPVREPVYDTSFETLPGFEELRVMQATGVAFGINNPFFRAHDGYAGPVTRIDDKPVLNFASYDYLGYNGRAEVRHAAQQAIERFGTSVSASRLVAGERPFHRELETRLAAFHGVDEAIAFVSGHAANVTTIGSLLGPDDAVFHDSLIHNSIIVGAQLAGARRRSFPHNDLDALERILATERPACGRALIVVEGHYSMDGDTPDLPRLLEMKQRFGAWLMVDEAHSLGVLGATGRGIAEQAGIDPRRVDIWMGTLSKTLASCGGYIAGSQPLVDFLKATAPGFVYSVGLPPAAAYASLAALDLLEADASPVAAVQDNGRYFMARAQQAGLSTGTAQGNAIVPIMVGDSLKAVMLSDRLLARGVNVLPIIHPAVPHKSARLRFFITATHTREHLDDAVRLVGEEMAESSRVLAAFGFGADDASASEHAANSPLAAQEAVP